MPSKQELELQVVELQRQIDDLKKRAPASDEPVEDNSVLHQVQDDLRKALADKEQTEKLHREACEQVRSLTGELIEAQKKLNERPTPKATDVQLEIMQAWELVDKVKYQYLPKDAEVAIIRKA